MNPRSPNGGTLSLGRFDRDGLIVVGISVAVFVVRLAMIGWNRGEFTDAVMQIELFENKNQYFLPLFTVIVQILSPIFGGEVWAGRFVSIVSISIVPYLLWDFGRKIVGREQALCASLMYLAAPVPWRWSLYAMTDALFAALFAVSVLYMLSDDGKEHGKLKWALFFGGVSCLTRYQGLILLPLCGLVYIGGVRRKECLLRIRDLWCFLPWVLFLIWVLAWGSAHGMQFVERKDAANSLMPSTATFALGFIKYFPCAVGYLFPVFCVVGLILLLRDKKFRWFSATSVLVFIVWLLIHARFKSFQYRYFLPLIAPACLFSGVGVVRLSKSIRICGILALLMVGVVLENGWMTARILSGTRNAFADFMEAGKYLASEEFKRDLQSVGAPENVPIYSNEAYNREYPYPVKLRFWSGRKDIGYASPGLKGGYVLCMHNVYAPGGEAAFNQFCARTGAKEIHKPFVAVNIPRLPTIMVDPFPYSTSMPGAMEHREALQLYETRIVYVPSDRR